MCQIDPYDYETASTGDVYRRWLCSNANGDEFYRSQKIFPENSCRITKREIEEDYANRNCWGDSWNNSCSMSLTCVRINPDMSLSSLTLEECLALGTLY